MDVTETLLPGVGIRYEFVTAGGEHVGLVALRDGRFELVRYDRGDPDAADAVVTLTQSEADVLAELLGAPRITERFADLTREVPGLVAAQLEVPATSRYAGRPLGEARIRTLTGASVVAVVSGAQVVASPGPDQVMHPGDVIVVVGTDQGLAGVRRLLDVTTG